MEKKSTGPSSYQAAIDNCNRLDGRLPTTAEILWIAAHTAEFDWADGNPSQYEFTGDYTSRRRLHADRLRPGRQRHLERQRPDVLAPLREELTLGRGRDVTTP